MKHKSYNIIFFISLLLIISATILSLYLLRQAQQDRYWAEHRRQMEVQLNSILQNLFEMEAAVRGYIIANDLVIIDTYNYAQVRLNNNIDIANLLIVDVPIQEANMDSLQRLIAQRIRVLNLTREAASAAGEKEKLSSLVILGDNIMVDIREHIEMMSAIELKFLNERTRSVQVYDNQSLVSVTIAGIITLLVISFGFAKLKRETYDKERALVEKLKTLEVLEESELRYRNLNESANDAIVIVDDMGKIISWNPAAVNLFGYTATEVKDMPINIIIPPKYKDAYFRGMRKLKDTIGKSKVIEQRIELAGRNKANKEIPIEVTIGHWYINNKHFFSGVIRDISERKKSEEKLARLIENLKRSNQDLEQFAYVASHDLQEPLRKIQSFGDRFIIKYASKTDIPGQEYITRMMEAANRMQVLIEDLLAFSRVSRNTENKEAVNLAEVLERVQDDLQLKIAETNTMIKSDTLPVIKKGSFIQLTQLFLNIINNAIKFQKPSMSPLINIEYRKVIGREIKMKNINPLMNRSYHEIKFSDNGIGFDTKYVDKIFTIFQRLHGRSEYAGTGIGLAVCRKICENHDGFISAYGTPDVGATFVVYLPA